MSPSRILWASLLALGAGAASPVLAQSAEGSCIIAGRLSDDGRWSPRSAGVQLLGPDQRPISTADKAALSAVRQARLTAKALLSTCDGNGQLALGPDAPGAKAPVPAVGPGTVTVESVSFPKLRRGGELVELKITVPAERVTMVTR